MHIKLLTSAYVDGKLRHPHEGVINTGDEDGKRLVEVEKVAEDVSADFADAADEPKERIAAEGGDPVTEPPENPHQSEVAPQADADAPKPQRRKAAADKE